MGFTKEQLAQASRFATDEAETKAYYLDRVLRTGAIVEMDVQRLTASRQEYDNARAAYAAYMDDDNY
jgi:hypothetical protein